MTERKILLTPTQTIKMIDICVKLFYLIKGLVLCVFLHLKFVKKQIRGWVDFDFHDGFLGYG
jgi:hypothetical protein